jgi:VWFA-related protein
MGSGGQRQVRVATFVALVAAAATWLAGAAPAGAGSKAGVSVTTVDGGSFPKVILHVSVVDGWGRPVHGLERKDFTVFEDDQPVRDLTSTQVYIGRGQGVGVVLAIDVSGSMASDGGRPIAAARTATLGFIGRLSRFDRAGVVSFGDRFRTVVRVGSRDVGAVRTLQARDATTHLYDAVLSASRMAARIHTSRKAVVVLTDGKDEGSSIGIDRLLRTLPSNVSVYTIGLRSASFQSGPLRRLAAAGGGRFLGAVAPEDLLGLYQQLARELRSEYLLTYRAPTKPARPRRVTVVVHAGNTQASAETSYRPPTAPLSRPKPARSSTVWPWAAAGGGVLLILIVAGALLLIGRRRPVAAPPASAPASGPAVLPGPALVAGGLRFPVNASEVVVGRDPGAGIRLEDLTVSRVHARLVRQNGEVMVEDLGSANGSYVNDERVEASHLQDGDRVRFGDSEFEYRSS